MSSREEWNEPWFNKSVWIFEHLQDLNLEPEEALMLLVINYFNEQGKTATYDGLMAKCHMEADDTEECFESLSAKGYLTIDTRNRSLRFVLDGLMDSPVKAGTPINHSLIQEFQEEFGRTLSSGDMERILEMGQKYGEGMVLQALSEAAVYDKRNLNYIENVLASWKARGLTTEDVENGKR